MNFKVKLVAASAMAALCSSSFAGGFMLTEQSVAGMGRAQSGAGMVGDDLCAAWFNPAGMTLLSGTQVQAGGAFTYLDFKYEGMGGDKHNGRNGGVAIPEAYFTSQITDDVWFGLAMVVPYGMETEYSSEYSGRARGMNAKVISFNLNPSLAWKVNEKVSVGAGVSMQYAYANFQNGATYPDGTVIPTPFGGIDISGENIAGASGRFKGNDIAFGMNLGTMWRPVDTVRIGLSWRSAIKHNVKGDFITKGLPVSVMNGKTNAKLLFKSQQHVILSGAWDATPQWTLSGMIRWTDWSTFKSLNVQSRATGATLKETVTNYKDSWLFSLGADYKYTSDLTLRAGIAYETSSQKDGHDRLATIPEDDRLWLSVGAGYKYNQNLKFDFGYLILKCLGPAGIYKSNDHHSPRIGEMKRSYAHLLGAQMVYKF